jgi:hypothetical protein
VTKDRQKESESRYAGQDPRSDFTDRLQCSAADPHATMRQIHRYQPGAQKENDKPAEINPDWNAVDVSHCDLALV